MSTSSPAVRPAVSPLPDIVGLGGAIAGLGGGLAMAVAGAIISASLNGDIWLEAKQIAGVLYGPAAAAQPGFVAGPVIVGWVSASFGLRLGLLFLAIAAAFVALAPVSSEA